MYAIVAVSSSWGIGRDNSPLFSLPGDLARFRALTSGGTVVMGRKTMGALPGGKPLSDRRNIVLTKGSLSVEGAETVHSCRELQSLLDGEAEESVFVIGGGSVYAALLPLCRRVLVTKVDADVEADTFFPNLDKLPNWTVLSESGPYTENGLTYRFIDYGNTSL